MSGVLQQCSGQKKGRVRYTLGLDKKTKAEIEISLKDISQLNLKRIYNIVRDKTMESKDSFQYKTIILVRLLILITIFFLFHTT